MSQKDMQKLLLKLVSKMPVTPEADKPDGESRVVTRSSSGKKNAAKRQKK